MKKQKIKEFFKENKSAIFALCGHAVGVAAAGALGYYLGKPHTSKECPFGLWTTFSTEEARNAFDSWMGADNHTYGTLLSTQLNSEEVTNMIAGFVSEFEGAPDEYVFNTIIEAAKK